MGLAADSLGPSSLLAFTLFSNCLATPIMGYYDSNRILGGSEDTIENHPYQVALEAGGRQYCAGSIISQTWVLTAAHCVYNKQISRNWLLVRAGSTLREQGGTIHPVKYYIQHPLYRPDTMDYDVALVRVKVPFRYGATVMPVILPRGVPKGYETVTVTGWGYLQNSQVMKPKRLMSTVMSTVDWNYCKRTYYPYYLTPRMLCAGDDSADICGGDSGGPMVQGNREQLGIVSWTLQCGDGLPSVYTNISSVVDWITKNTDLSETLIFID